jgi:glycosyltransferase involved in cell wall biosynthesis
VLVPAHHRPHAGDDRIRVLMVSPSARPGGAEVVFESLVDLCPAHGIDVRPVLLEPGPLSDHLRARCTAHLVIDAHRLRHPRAVARTMRSLHRQLEAFRADLVYSNMPKAHLYCALPARAHAVSAVWCQAMIPSAPHPIERVASILPATRVLAVSEAGAAAQRRIAGSPPVTVVHPGIDLRRFAPRTDRTIREANGIGPDDVVIGIVGRLQPWKGQHRFLHAARLVHQQIAAARFAVVGGAVLGWEGDYPTRLRRLARDLGIGDRVIFTGHTEEVERWTAALDIAVNASEPEPFGLVVLEAMATGKPVVAVDAGGPAEIIRHGETGLLSRTSRPDDLAREIIRLADDPELRRRLGRAGRAEVEGRFAAEHMVGRFAAAVRSCLADRSRRPGVP